MPKLTGPLMSITASGSYAKTLTFGTGPGGPYVKRYRSTPTTQTSASVGIRAMVSFLTKLWKGLSPNDKATWAAEATRLNISPYNVFFTTNTKRWAANLAPTTALQTVSTTPYAPTLTLSATGHAGYATLAISPTLIPRHVNVTAGSPAPSPDCIGTYDYFEEHNSQHAYRRSLPVPMRLYYVGIYYHLLTTDNYNDTGGYWSSDQFSPINGTYTPHTPSTGNAIVSAPIQAAPGPAAIAVAIFRSPSTITTPDRRLCRAVLSLDGSGNLSWTDRNQVGANPSQTSGLPTGTYHYMAVPLSLDGRMGTPTADTQVTVP
jgi:hypothetical protein